MRFMLLALAASLAVAACSQKDPAATAIDAAESALAAVHEQAQKYVPKQYAEVKARLDEARKAFGEERYEDALAIAKDMPARARELSEAATAARDRLAAEIAVDWKRLQAELPGLVAGLESRIAELSSVRRLPEGIGQETLERARDGLELAKGAWGQAREAFDAGNLEGAVARGLEADRLVRELREAVGMTPAQPEAEPVT